MITEDEFERYCDEHELRRTFDKHYWFEYQLYENWNERVFIAICVHGYVETAKWLYSLGNIDIHPKQEFGFRYSCSYGHLEVAKWLYSLGNIDIHVENELAFRWSCEYNKKEVVKWFIFELGYMSDPIINEYKICQEIINDEIYKRKSHLMKGYVYGGGTVNHPLSKVSFHNFCRCLMMI